MTPSLLYSIYQVGNIKCISNIPFPHYICQYITKLSFKEMSDSNRIYLSYSQQRIHCKTPTKNHSKRAPPPQHRFLELFIRLSIQGRRRTPTDREYHIEKCISSHTLYSMPIEIPARDARKEVTFCFVAFVAVFLPINYSIQPAISSSTGHNLSVRSTRLHTLTHSLIYPFTCWLINIEVNFRYTNGIRLALYYPFSQVRV